MELNYISSQIIGAAINVHKELGPGLLESVYQICIVIELNDMEMRIKIVELKSVEKVLNVHKKQLLAYLRLAKKSLGLLINFNETVLKDGITRIINTPHNSF